MHDRFAPGFAIALGRRGAAMLAAAGVAVMLLASVATEAASAASEGTVWLCKPGLANNPCRTSLTTMVETGDGGQHFEKYRRGRKPPIDCFYVYPTVSSQPTVNANLEIDPEETQIAVQQASRFQTRCRVFAPMYPQLTVAGITGSEISGEGAAKAYLGVLSAWREYLKKFNKGRGFVLIGHSQGAFVLDQLIKEQIDPDPALRKQLVSALLMGGNVKVPEGQLVGGDFQNVPACQSASQTHCVVAYSTFAKEPPLQALFGRVSGFGQGGSGMEVLCVNPTLSVQDGSVGALLPFEGTTKFPGILGFVFQTPVAQTAWVSSSEKYTAQCMHANGASWLQVDNIGPPGDPRLTITETLGPDWGLHLGDINLALGNLTGMVGDETQTYLGE